MPCNCLLIVYICPRLKKYFFGIGVQRNINPLSNRLTKEKLTHNEHLCGGHFSQKIVSHSVPKYNLIEGQI